MFILDFLLYNVFILCRRACYKSILLLLLLSLPKFSCRSWYLYWDFCHPLFMCVTAKPVPVTKNILRFGFNLLKNFTKKCREMQTTMRSEWTQRNYNLPPAERHNKVYCDSEPQCVLGRQRGHSTTEVYVVMLNMRMTCHAPGLPMPLSLLAACSMEQRPLLIFCN